FLHMLGVDQFVLNNFTHSFRFLMEAMQFYRTLGERCGEAACHSTLGDICRSQGNYAQAINQFEQAKIIYTEMDEPTGVHSSLLSLASVFRIKGELTLASTKLTEALELELAA